MIHDWNILLEGFTLFERNRPNKRRGKVAFYRMHSIFLEMYALEMHKTNDGRFCECIWINIKGKKNGVAIGAYYRSSNQTGEID